MKILSLGVMIALILLDLTEWAESAYPLKILGLFPHQARSHFDFFHPLMRGLAEAGHEVTVVSHFPDKSPPVKYKDIVLEEDIILKESVDLQIFGKPKFYDHFRDFFLIHEWGMNSCNTTLRSKGMAEILKKKNYYDVIITEQFCSDCMNAVAYVLKAPVVAMSSCALMPWHYARFGAPANPSHIPNLWLGYTDEMSFMERINNWLSYHIMNFLHDYVNIPATDAMVRYKFGHDLPSVRDLVKETSLMFVNQHFTLSGVKPLPPKIIEIGGIHIQKAKPLEVELERFVENAEHGVIIISWGHMIRADTMPAAARDGLLRAIKRLKQRVIWKWENDTIPNQPDNLLIAKWLPQRDLLCHPNVKVFMTHGGLLGSSEAAYCGVPIVVTPQFGDQFLNAAALEHRGMGLILPFNQISENTVLRSVRKVLENKYQENAKVISHAYKHRPQTPMQTALWWVEHVAHTQGAPLLKSSAIEMSSIVYHSLDIYFTLLIFLGASLASWFWLLRKLFVPKSLKTQKSKSE